MWNDAWRLLESGGPVMPPLVAVSLALWFALGYRAAVLRRGSRRSVRALLERYARGEAKPPRGLVDRAAQRALAVAALRPPHLRHHLEDALADLEALTTRYRRLVLTLVGAAPLLGLLGTVMGMIETFDSLGSQTLFSRDGGIAGGIAQALVTTQMGLAVAIPGLVMGRLLDRRAARIQRELAQIRDLVCSGQVPR